MGRSRARKPNLGDLAEVLSDHGLGRAGGKVEHHEREVSAMKAWHAVLASILLVAPSLANAKTVQIFDDRGGLVIAYQMQWAMLAPQRVNVQIAGPCVSACTILLGYIPREKICVSSRASLGFHLATPDFVTQDLLRAYPLDIRLWIAQHGGLTHQIIWLQAPDIYGYFRKC